MCILPQSFAVHAAAKNKNGGTMRGVSISKAWRISENDPRRRAAALSVAMRLTLHASFHGKHE
jgi:hypothetical protein